MGRRTQIAGDTAVAAGAGGAGAVIGVAVASAMVNRWSLWWLMAPISAFYHLGALVSVLSGRPLLVVVVMLAEVGWVRVAAGVGRRNGARAYDASIAQDLVADDPAIDAVRRLQALNALEPLTRPAQGHDLALAICWFTAPLQTAAYRAAFSQACNGMTAPACESTPDVDRATTRVPIVVRTAVGRPDSAAPSGATTMRVAGAGNDVPLPPDVEVDGSSADSFAAV